MRYGTYAHIAEAAGLTLASVKSGLTRRGGSTRIAVAIARLARVPPDTILYGTLASTDRCPTCGQKLPEKNP